MPSSGAESRKSRSRDRKSARADSEAVIVREPLTPIEYTSIRNWFLLAVAGVAVFGSASSKESIAALTRSSQAIFPGDLLS